VQRVALTCTPAPLAQIQSIVTFHSPFRFQQHLKAEQVAALLSLLSLKPVPATLPAPQGNIETAAQCRSAVPQPAMTEHPSASCGVTQPAADYKAPQLVSSKAAQTAALENGPVTHAAAKSRSAVAPASGDSIKHPFAFQLNGHRGKASSASEGAQHKRKLSLASVLEDVFEEVMSTPRSSSKRRKRRREPSALKAQPADQLATPIDLTSSPAKAQQKPANLEPLIDLTGSGCSR